MPEVVIIGGPNGADKSTFSRVALPEGMAFVNADEIAKGLPEYETCSIYNIPLTDHWQVYANVAQGVPLLISQGERGRRNRVVEANVWRRIKRQPRRDRNES